MDELLKALYSLKNNKTPGPDLIVNECYKTLPPQWLHYILNLFNAILEKEYLPPDWANSLIKMIFKKGDATNPDNHKPIALENTCLKLYVTAIKNRLYNLCENESLFPEEQSGFRVKRSCTDNIFVLKSLIDLQINIRKKFLAGIFIDYKKAFDTVPHDKMFQKLDYMGINGKAMRTISKIYCNASISIELDNDKSEKIKVTKGVLQGDVLSPLLYNLYTSDLGKFLRNEGFRGVAIKPNQDILLITFADDTVILINSIIDCQDKLNTLDKYCEKNELIINPSKTCILNFFKGRPIKMRDVYYKQNKIEVVSEAKYLGVTFANSGKFLKHTD